MEQSNFDLIPNEIIELIADNFNIKDFVQFISTCKYILYLFTFDSGFNDPIKLLKQISIDRKCMYCNDYNWAAFYGRCNNCSINCEDCGRRLPLKLTCKYSIIDYDFEYNESFEFSLHKCRFGCRFLCIICDTICKKSSLVGRDFQDWIVCNHCAEDFSIPTRKIKSNLIVKYDDDLSNEFDPIVSTRNQKFMDASADYIDKYDPWWFNTACNKITIGRLSERIGSFNHDYKKIYVNQRLQYSIMVEDAAIESIKFMCPHEEF